MGSNNEKGTKKKTIMKMVKTKARTGEKYTWRQRDIGNKKDIDKSYLSELLAKEMKRGFLGKYKPSGETEGAFYFLLDYIEEAEQELQEEMVLPSQKDLKDVMISKNKGDLEPKDDSNDKEGTIDTKVFVEEKFEEIKKAEEKVEDVEEDLSLGRLVQQLARDHEKCIESFKNDEVMEYLKNNIDIRPEKEAKPWGSRPYITTYLKIWKAISKYNENNEQLFDEDDLRELIDIFNSIDIHVKSTSNKFEELIKDITVNLLDNYFKNKPVPGSFLDSIFEEYLTGLEIYRLEPKQGIFYELITNHIHNKEDKKHLKYLIKEKVEEGRIDESIKQHLEELMKHHSFLPVEPEKKT